MEKHKCKLCFRNFSNGRALGGHMRSHMMNLPIPPKPETARPPPALQPPVLAAAGHISDEVESVSYSYEEDHGEREQDLSNGHRENPKRSTHMVDPEFAFAVDAGSVVLQDSESETKSSMNPTRRRSKRIRKSVTVEEDQFGHQRKQIQLNLVKKFQNLVNSSKAESWAGDPEPASSVSDATTEDVAFCLMMLSRDKWKRQNDQVEQEYYHYVDDDDDDDDDEQDDMEEEEEAERSFEESDESEELKSTKARVRGKHKCETCNKVFRSYQALGGHRASHKKMKICTRKTEPELKQDNAAGTSAPMAAEKKVHQCPVCFRIFSSGQALGGHKRTHVIVASSSTPLKNSAKFGYNLIDLNLPAPVDDEDDNISQIEVSAVSDAEFVNSIRQ